MSYNVDDTKLYFTYKYTQTESAACLQIYILLSSASGEQNICTHTVNDIYLQ